MITIERFCADNLLSRLRMRGINNMYLAVIIQKYAQLVIQPKGIKFHVTKEGFTSHNRMSLQG